MSALGKNVPRKAFFQRYFCVGETDLNDIFAMLITVGISNLADKINGTLPFGKCRVDLHITDVHQFITIDGSIYAVSSSLRRNITKKKSNLGREIIPI